MHSRILNSLLKAALVCVAMIFSLSAYAQNSFTVKAKLADQKTGDPVGFATASLTVKGRSSLLAMPFPCASFLIERLYKYQS